MWGSGNLAANSKPWQVCCSGRQIGASTPIDREPVLVSSMLSHLGKGWWLHAVSPPSSLGSFQRISLDFIP